jgi:predicted ATPase
MLTQINIKKYKSLFNVNIQLEPLTVFIGPNGSGKSNICEALLSQQPNSSQVDFNRQKIANLLTDIFLNNRERFIELEQRFIKLMPNIVRILLKQDGSSNQLHLVDKYSDHLIPATDISGGTLRILAFLTALYQVDSPSIICFEEPENGIHPWLLHKIMELLNKVATEGIAGNQAQILITTHSPVLLNYVNPKQVRAVELNNKGKTQISPLPIDSAHFQAALEAYDEELGELWFSNLFGGNPK